MASAASLFATATIELQSKSGQPLTRYFPEVVAALREPQSEAVRAGWRIDRAREWQALLRRSAAAHPSGRQPHPEAALRHARATGCVRSAGGRKRRIPDCSSARTNAAACWKTFTRAFCGGNLDRSLARHRQRPRSQRAGWTKCAASWMASSPNASTSLTFRRARHVKVKTLRSADCVVGGFRYGSGKKCRLTAARPV